MSIEEMEKQWKRSEKERARAEKLREIRAEGFIVTSPEQGKLELIRRDAETLKSLFSGMMSAEAYKRLEKVLDLATLSAKVDEDLTHLNTQTGAVHGMLAQMISKLQDIETQQKELNQRVSDEIEKSKKQRDLELDTLQKLNKYLENWL